MFCVSGPESQPWEELLPPVRQALYRQQDLRLQRGVGPGGGALRERQVWRTSSAIRIRRREKPLSSLFSVWQLKPLIVTVPIGLNLPYNISKTGSIWTRPNSPWWPGMGTWCPGRAPWWWWGEARDTSPADQAPELAPDQHQVREHCHHQFLYP